MTWICITYCRWKYKDRTAFLFWFPPFDSIFSDFTQSAIWYLAETLAACQCSWPRVSQCVAWESDAEPTWLFYNPHWEHNVSTFLTSPISCGEGQTSLDWPAQWNQLACHVHCTARAASFSFLGVSKEMQLLLFCCNVTRRWHHRTPFDLPVVPL